jgi:beta-N-acetylhexosaminidase
MTAHVRFEAFDRLPATLSPLSLQILRRDVGFQGACISDDLEMKAIADTYGVVDGAELAISAGCDGVLVCHTLALQHQAIDGIARGARAGPLPRERLAEAAARMEKLQRFARPASAIRPETAARACATLENRAFVEALTAGGATATVTAERPRDPTEWRVA